MPHRHRVRHSRPRYHSGRDSHFYLYSEPECYCDGVPCLCPEKDTGAIVRDKVLSPGFYWYDAPAEQAPGFQGWLRDNSALVKTRKTVTSVESSVFSSGPNLHVWALFEVLFPVPWLDATKFGFPNTASKDTESTVASSGAEPQKDPLDKIADSVKEIVPFLAPVSTGALVIGGLVGLGFIFRKELFSHGIRKLRSARGRRSSG